MQPLLTRQQMVEADRYTIEKLGFPECLLMEHAALAVVSALEARFGNWLSHTKGLLIAGPGNNGGDALAVARLLASRGLKELEVIAPCGASHALQSQLLKSQGIEISANVREGGVWHWVVDGLFGTGLARPLTGDALTVVKWLNHLSGPWKVAVDIPSGLCSDTGLPLGDAVVANETVTLGYIKRGLVTGEASDYVGALRLSPIQIARVVPGLEPTAYWYEPGDVPLPERKPSGHKGNYGHTYLWAGAAEMQGASILASLAALRTASGLTSLVGYKDVLAQIRPRLNPEVMTRDFDEALFQETSDGKVFVAGPGMGKNDSIRETILSVALDSEWPLLLDADALNFIAQHPKPYAEKLSSRSAGTVLTPHPKEAARLLGTSTETVQSDRFAAARALCDRFSSTCVLKGKGTVVASPGVPLVVVSQGSPALSKGGSGDVLSGIIGALLAQRLKPHTAATLGVYVHGRASELWEQRHGESRSALAEDLTKAIGWVWKELSCAT